MKRIERRVKVLDETFCVEILQHILSCLDVGLTKTQPIVFIILVFFRSDLISCPALYACTTPDWPWVGCAQNVCVLILIFTWGNLAIKHLRFVCVGLWLSFDASRGSNFMDRPHENRLVCVIRIWKLPEKVFASAADGVLLVSLKWNLQRAHTGQFAASVVTWNHWIYKSEVMIFCWKTIHPLTSNELLHRIRRK